ncbi:MAG: hypothetical protein U0704_03880 [Candidatus Eisenbacteria bacterium]
MVRDAVVHGRHALVHARAPCGAFGERGAARDVLHGAAQRARAEQHRARRLHDLDTLEVGVVHQAQCAGQVLRRLDARVVHERHDAAAAHAAQRHGGLPRAVARQRHAGQRREPFGRRRGGAAFERLHAQHAGGPRCAAQRERAARAAYEHLVERVHRGGERQFDRGVVRTERHAALGVGARQLARGHGPAARRERGERERAVGAGTRRTVALEHADDGALDRRTALAGHETAAQRGGGEQCGQAHRERDGTGDDRTGATHDTSAGRTRQAGGAMCRCERPARERRSFDASARATCGASDDLDRSNRFTRTQRSSRVRAFRTTCEYETLRLPDTRHDRMKSGDFASRERALHWRGRASADNVRGVTFDGAFTRSVRSVTCVMPPPSAESPHRGRRGVPPVTPASPALLATAAAIWPQGQG